MKAYIYLWQGSRSSLLFCYILGVFVVDSDYKEPPGMITSKYATYNPGRFIDPNLLKDIDINLYYLNPSDLNKEGDYAIYKLKTKIITNLKIKYKNIDITVFSKPTKLIERLLVRYCIIAWRSRLKSWSATFINDKKTHKVRRLRIKKFKYNFIDLEKDLELHKSYLLSCKVLPCIYDWMKVIKLFKDIEPKPAWYCKEIDSYKKSIGDF